MSASIWRDDDCPDQACDRPLGHTGEHRAYLRGSTGPRCVIHGDPVIGGRCGSCDQVAYDQAEAHLADIAQAEADRADYEADRAEQAQWDEQHGGRGQ